jgi:hypothetical protein
MGPEAPLEARKQLGPDRRSPRPGPPEATADRVEHLAPNHRFRSHRAREPQPNPTRRASSALGVGSEPEPIGIGADRVGDHDRDDARDVAPLAGRIGIKPQIGSNGGFIGGVMMLRRRGTLRLQGPVDAAIVDLTDEELAALAKLDPSSMPRPVAPPRPPQAGPTRAPRARRSHARWRGDQFFGRGYQATGLDRSRYLRSKRRGSVRWAR